MTDVVRMAVTASGAATLAMTDVLVATLRDGSVGFVAADSSWLPPGGAVVLTAGDSRLEGAARVVRSGPAYEEVRGRLRARAGRLERWRLRRDRPVVLVRVIG